MGFGIFGRNVGWLGLMALSHKYGDMAEMLPIK